MSPSTPLPGKVFKASAEIGHKPVLRNFRIFSHAQQSTASNQSERLKSRSQLESAVKCAAVPSIRRKLGPRAKERSGHSASCAA